MKRVWPAAGSGGFGESGWRVERCPDHQAYGASPLSSGLCSFLGPQHPPPHIRWWPTEIPITARPMEQASLCPKARSSLQTLGSPWTVTSLWAEITESKAPSRSPHSQQMQRSYLSDEGMNESRGVPAFPDPSPSRSWSHQDGVGQGQRGTVWTRGFRTQTSSLGQGPGQP